GDRRLVDGRTTRSYRRTRAQALATPARCALLHGAPRRSRHGLVLGLGLERGPLLRRPRAGRRARIPQDECRFRSGTTLCGHHAHAGRPARLDRRCGRGRDARGDRRAHGRARLRPSDLALGGVRVMSTARETGLPHPRRPLLSELGTIYVTRAAARSYAESMRLGEEEARRELTCLMLGAHRTEAAPGKPELWRARTRRTGVDVSARVSVEPPLVVVVACSARRYGG